MMDETEEQRSGDGNDLDHSADGSRGIANDDGILRDVFSCNRRGADDHGVIDRAD